MIMYEEILFFSWHEHKNQMTISAHPTRQQQKNKEKKHVSSNDSIRMQRLREREKHEHELDGKKLQSRHKPNNKQKENERKNTRRESVCSAICSIESLARTCLSTGCSSLLPPYNSTSARTQHTTKPKRGIFIDFSYFTIFILLYFHFVI